MTPERWKKLEALFHEAIELQGKARAAHLAKVCGDDEQLRAEVERLLAAHERESSFLDSPISEQATALTDDGHIEPLVGRCLGPYQVRSLLGRGGMGEVYLAEDYRLERKVALKVLPAAFTQNPDRVRRFEREAKAASALNHPNILTIYEIGQAEGLHFIATEFVDGVTLRQQIESGRMSLAETLSVAVQMASALSAAHEAGIVHRDIKPENVMLRPDGLVKVLDFGLAKLTERPAATSDAEVDSQTLAATHLSTDPGVVMGTASYMSPEQARGLKVDARSDIFSLGVVTYEMIAGQAPFVGATTSDVIAAILTKEPAPLSRHAPTVSAELERIVCRALEKDREERYQVIRDLLLDLRRLKQQLEFEAELARARSSGADVEVAPQPEAAKLETAKEAARRSRSHKAIDSLAVLPLVNANSEPDTEYLSDGITESLINNLSQLPKLKVMARSTVFRFKGREADAQAVGRELNVRAVLSGRVLHREGQLVIRMELVDVADGSHLWGEQYNRKLEDIFAIEEEIAQEISEKLRLKLSRGEKKRLAKRQTANTEAYQLYLKGRHFWNRRTAEGMQKAIGYFQQAIDLDPNYALAFAGLADSYALLGFVQIDALAPKEAMPKAREAALNAIELDPGLAEAHASLAFVRQCFDWDWPEVERGFKRAIDLNVGYATAHDWYSVAYLALTGRLDEALAETRRAQELDPLSLIINKHVGWHYYFKRQYDQAIQQYLKTLEIDPNFVQARLDLGKAYVQKAMFEEAIAELNKARSLSANSPAIVAALGHAYALSGRESEARQVIEKLKKAGRRHYIASYLIAEIYVGLGEKKLAFEWLEKAYAERSGYLVYLKVEPRFDSLRSDQRFADLLRRIGLAPG
jgi:serine/threonine-protein kinase